MTDLTGAFSSYGGPSFDLNDWVRPGCAMAGTSIRSCLLICHVFPPTMQDVSGVTSLAGTFSFSTFDGAIDAWDVSSVVTLEGAFEESSFTGDVSNWVGPSVKLK